MRDFTPGDEPALQGIAAAIAVTVEAADGVEFELPELPTQSD